MFIEVDVGTEETPRIFKIRKPLGRLAAIWGSIMLSYMPSIDTEDDDMTPMQRIQLAEGVVEFTNKLLPQIYVEGPVKVDEMEWEDQFGLFMALMDSGRKVDTPFRIVK